MRRRGSDDWETFMWQQLRNRQRCNQKFRREHPLGIYTADFYCIAAKLVVEIDGASHLTEEAKQHDAARDEWMQKQGIEILSDSPVLKWNMKLTQYSCRLMNALMRRT